MLICALVVLGLLAFFLFKYGPGWADPLGEDLNKLEVAGEEVYRDVSDKVESATKPATGAATPTGPPKV